jgi:hypothetical protein
MNGQVVLVDEPSLALLWRRFSAFEGEQRQAQAIQFLKHAIEGSLIGKRAGKLRRAIRLLRNLQSLQPLLPALVQMPFDTDRNVHGYTCLSQAQMCSAKGR